MKKILLSTFITIIISLLILTVSSCNDDGCNHEWGEWSISSHSTCTEQGAKQRKCSLCGELQADSIDVIDHIYDTDNLVWTWNGYEVATASAYCTMDNTHTKLYIANVTEQKTVEESCTNEGTRTYTATISINGVSYSSTKEESIEASGHTEVIDPAVLATCTQNGLTEGSHCSVCEEIIIPQTEISKAEHTEIIDAAVIATCTQNGLTEGSHCSVCKATIIPQTVIPKTEHKEVINKGYESTCKEHGLSDGKQCLNCDLVIEEQIELPLKSHTVIIDTAIAPSCTTTGLSQGSHCSSCGTIIEKQEILSSRHDYKTDTVDFIYNDDNTVNKIIVPCKNCDEHKTVTSIYAEYVGEDVYIDNEANKSDIKVYLVLNSYERILINDFNVNSLIISQIGANYINIGYYNFDTTVIINGCIPETHADQFTYKISNGNIIITSYTGTESSIRIPEFIEGHPVTTIGNSAFKNNLYIQSVTLADNIRVIEPSAFSGCSSLVNIILNDGLTTIDYNAFSDTAITELIIPDSVTTISNAGYTSYNYSFVDNCQKLKRVVLGKGITTISAFMFEGLQALEEVVIGENVTTIGDYAFANCTMMTSVTLPNSVNTLKKNVFDGCINLNDVTFSNSLTTIGEYAFSGCASLTSVKLPKSVKEIKNSAFIECASLEAITLNDGLTTIDYNAFSGTAITELIIPDSVTEISNAGYTSYNYSFVENCQKLKRVVLGKGITTISAFMFKGLYALEEVVIGENVTTIGDYAFDSCVSLNTVTLPDSITTIGSYAFSGTGLTSIKIPKNVTTIKEYAFSSCQKLEYLLIDGTALKSVGANVTNACPSARRIFYKGSVIEWNAISINTNNSAPFNQIPYIYSETDPQKEGNYWHYSGSGEPIVWNISLSEYKVYALSNAYTGTMGSSMLSCSSYYVKEMEADTDFMVQKTLYETATIVSDLGAALDNQMSKEQLYMIVLLDVLGYNHAESSNTPELLDTISTYGAFVDGYIEIINDGVESDILAQSFPSLNILNPNLELIITLTDMAEDKEIALENLLGFAFQCQNSIDILNEIANDTNNDKDLRNAASKVIEIITSAYNGTLENLLNKDLNSQYINILTTEAINTVWDIGCDLYLPAKIASWVAEGIKISLDLFYDTGVSVDAYYKLKVTSVIEGALRDQINSLNGDYLRRENINESSKIYAVINLYSSAISKGYDYTLDYLNSVNKDSEYIYNSYIHNKAAFDQFEAEVESNYYALYGNTL